MKKTGLLLLLLAITAGVYFLTGSTKSQAKEGKTTISIQDRDFVTKDRDAVKTITIKTKGNPMTHLSKVNGEWYINNKHRANDRIVGNMLGALSVMQIQYIPTKAENQTALKRMELHGIDIKTYGGNGTVLTDFVLGTNINSEYGTYFRKADAYQTYVMEIPAQNGGLRGYFTQTLEELRSSNVFAYDPEKITKVSMEYPKDKKNSFMIEQNGSQKKLYDVSGEQVDSAIDNVVDAYLKDFRTLASEFVKNGHYDKDTVASYIPFATLSIEAKDEPMFSIDIYSVLDLVDKGIVTRSVDDITINHERFYALTNRGDFYRIQNRILERFLKKVDYFYEQ